ncbi:hypothetical protein GCM10018965_010470 [Nonomuraea roseola]
MLEMVIISVSCRCNEPGVGRVRREKYQYTVCHGGKPVGRYRRGRPERTTYRIALTIYPRGCFSGRPPVFGSGGVGSISSHCASVRFEG